MSAIAQDLLNTIRAAGGEVRLIGRGRLQLVAPKALPDELVQRVRGSKFELIETLGGSPPIPVAERWHALLDPDEEERAAIIEYDGGAPRAWAEAFARLHPDRPPRDVSYRQWRQFVDDCGRFIDRWAVKADAWAGPLDDLFGWDTFRPFSLIAMQMGLGWRIEGGAVVDVKRNVATIHKPNRQPICFRRQPRV